MKNLTLITLLLLLAASLFSQKYETNLKWSSTDLLTTSESVLYNPTDNFLYVSCINGNPVDKDGNGFISQVNLSGEIVLLKWAEGINAPKGMTISGNSLFVSDIDQVIEFEMASGKLLKKYPVENAEFLNDLATGQKGEIYITDMSTNIIHILKDGVISEWLSDERIINPNGLVISGDRLFIGTKNGIFDVNTLTKEYWHVIKNTGGIDGIKRFDDNHFIISDWQGKVQVVNYEQDMFTLLNTTENKLNAADFEYIPKIELLIIPTFFDNRIMAYDLLKKGR